MQANIQNGLASYQMQEVRSDGVVAQITTFEGIEMVVQIDQNQQVRVLEVKTTGNVVDFLSKISEQFKQKNKVQAKQKKVEEEEEEDFGGLFG